MWNAGGGLKDDDDVGGSRTLATAVVQVLVGKRVGLLGGMRRTQMIGWTKMCPKMYV